MSEENSSTRIADLVQATRQWHMRQMLGHWQEVNNRGYPTPKTEENVNEENLGINPADRAADKIWQDLSGRKGVDLSACDADTQREIRAMMSSQILAALAECLRDNDYPLFFKAPLKPIPKEERISNIEHFTKQLGYLSSNPLADAFGKDFECLNNGPGPSADPITNEERCQRIAALIGQLAELCDAVQVLASWRRPGDNGTYCKYWGTGNWRGTAEDFLDSNFPLAQDMSDKKQQSEPTLAPDMPITGLGSRQENPD